VDNLFKMIKDGKYKWDYYSRKKKNKLKENLCKNWDCEKEHKNFIDNFLEIAGKSNVLSHFTIEEIDRAIHINSVFFLGCIFYKKLCLENKIKFKRDNSKHDEFHFVWFLTSLVHDFGYSIEKKEDNDYRKIEDIVVSHNLLDKCKNKYLENSYLNLTKNEKILVDNIKQYFKFRREKGKTDHGIYAGLNLYNSLLNNRKERDEQKENETQNLYWGKDLEEFYAIASYAIATHNMWRIKEGDKNVENYQKYGLCNLILDGKGIKKLSIEKEPFSFLLALIDTLEPTKIYDCCKPKYVLENIDIQFCEKEITIKNGEESKLDFEKLEKRAKGMESWLDLSVKLNNNEIIISVN